MFRTCPFLIIAGAGAAGADTTADGARPEAPRAMEMAALFLRGRSKASLADIGTELARTGYGREAGVYGRPVSKVAAQPVLSALAPAFIACIEM